MPSDDAMRNSRTPVAASAATVTFSLQEVTFGVGAFGSAGFGDSLPGITSAETPVPSTRTLYAPASEEVRHSTVTSVVVPRCTATGDTCVTIGNEICAVADEATTAAHTTAITTRMGLAPLMANPERERRGGFCPPRRSRSGFAEQLYFPSTYSFNSSVTVSLFCMMNWAFTIPWPFANHM